MLKMIISVCKIQRKSGKSMEYTGITPRKNPSVTDAVKLKDKKNRDRLGLFYAEGYKLLEEVISAKIPVNKLFFTESALQTYPALIEKSGENCEKFLVSDEVYGKLTDEKAPQGLFFCAKTPERLLPDGSSLRDGGFVILDEVQNPQNLGAIIRSAFALRADKIVITNGCADPYGPKALRAAMGAIFRSKLYFAENAFGFIEELEKNGCRTICTRLSKDSEKLGSFEFKAGDSIVIGNEGHGVGDMTAKVCAHSLYIPMNDGAESLNAACAAAITIWEMKKCSPIL